MGTIHWMGTEMSLHCDWRASSSSRDGAWEGDIPGKKMLLGRYGHQEGDVPQDVVTRKEMFLKMWSPGRRHSQEIPKKQMSLGRRCP